MEFLTEGWFVVSVLLVGHRHGHGAEHGSPDPRARQGTTGSSTDLRE